MQKEDETSVPVPLDAVSPQVAATLVEAALLLYLYLWHRTRLALHHPWEMQIIGKIRMLQHPMATWLDPPRSPICAFGKGAAKVGAVLLAGRARAWSFTGRKWLPPAAWVALYLLGLAAALVMNFNAFLYLLPPFLIEYFCVYAA